MNERKTVLALLLDMLENNKWKKVEKNYGDFFSTFVESEKVEINGVRVSFEVFPLNAFSQRVIFIFGEERKSFSVFKYSTLGLKLTTLLHYFLASTALEDINAYLKEKQSAKRKKGSHTEFIGTNGGFITFDPSESIKKVEAALSQLKEK